MYSRPVADSIERACKQSAQAATTRSAGTRGRRSVAARRRVPGDPPNASEWLTIDRTCAGGRDPCPEEHDLETTTASSDRASRMSGARQLGRDEVPVAQDHRREDAAGRCTDDDRLCEACDRSGGPTTPGQCAEEQGRAGGSAAHQLDGRHRAWCDAARRSARRGDRYRKAPSAAARGPSGWIDGHRRAPSRPARQRPMPMPAPRTRPHTGRQIPNSRASPRSAAEEARRSRTTQAPSQSRWSS